MGLQSISEKKVRKAVSETGLDLIRVMRHSNHLWFGWVREGEGHWHARIDPSTWEWAYEPGHQFSSCREGTYGPGVVPSQQIVEAYERLEQARLEELARKDAEAVEMIAAWTEATQAWLDAKAQEVEAVARVHARGLTEDLQAQGLLKPGEEVVWETEGEK